jgi:hypothetical protein
VVLCAWCVSGKQTATDARQSRERHLLRDTLLQLQRQKFRDRGSMFEMSSLITLLGYGSAGQ